MIEQEDDREINPVETKITCRKIDSDVQHKQKIAKINVCPVDKKEDTRTGGDACVKSCMKNTIDMDEIDVLCPLCGINTKNIPRNIEFANLNEGVNDGENQIKLDECCGYMSTDTDYLCPVCEEVIKNVEFYDSKPNEANKRDICNESNINGAEGENVCAVCRQNNEEIIVRNDKSSSRLDILGQPCRCKRDVEFIDQREIEKRCKETTSQDTIDNSLCSACASKINETKVENTTKCKKNIEFIDPQDSKCKNVESNRNLCMQSEIADSINHNICSACGGKKNETKIGNDDCSSIKSPKSDVSCKCNKNNDQRDVNRTKSSKEESICLKSRRSDKEYKNVCSTCGSKKSLTKRDNNVCGSSKTLKSVVSHKCNSDETIKSETSCKCKKSIEFIDQRENDRKRATEVDDVCQKCNKEGKKDKDVCSMCGNKKKEPKSGSSICSSNNSSKSETSSKCKPVKPLKFEVPCSCKKGNQNVNQSKINGKQSIEGQVCSMCGNKTRQPNNDDNICGTNKLSNSDVSCKCRSVKESKSEMSSKYKKSTEITDQKEVDRKKIKEDKEVCAVCGNNNDQTSATKICGLNNPSKSKIACNCKQGIEFIDQREIDSRQSSESGCSCKTPKIGDRIDKNFCSVCVKNKNRTKYDKNVCGSTTALKSDTDCECKRDIKANSQRADSKPCSCKSIVFIDQREIDARKKHDCKSSTQHKIDKNSQDNICCNTRSKVTVIKNNSGSLKSSKSSSSYSCKKNTEFIDQRKIDKITEKTQDAHSVKENICPTCNSNKDIGKNPSSHSYLSNIKSNASNKCVKTASKGSIKDICLAEENSSSNYVKENIGEFIKTYKEVIKIKRVPDKDGNICEKQIIIRTKIERQIGTLNSDNKLEKKDKNNKEVKQSKSDNFSRCSSLGSNRDPGKSNSSDLISITSQSISVTSVNLSQSSAQCSTKNNTDPTTKRCGTSSNSSINSKSRQKDAVHNSKSNKSVDSRYKVKIVSKDDVCKSNNYENEIEVTPSTIIILKKFLSQPSKSSCKLDTTELIKSSKKCSGYKPECSCESISLPCEKKSESKSLYQKLGEYLSDVNPFKGQAEPCLNKASVKQSQSMNCIPTKSDVSCSPKREISNSKSKLSNKKCLCSKSKFTQNKKAELNCNCKLSTSSLKDECLCLKSIFSSSDVTKRSEREHKIEAKDSCSCNKISSRTSESIVKDPGDRSYGKSKSSCNMSASKSKTEKNFSKCLSNKNSSINTQTKSACQTCSKSQVSIASDVITPTKSKRSCDTSNSKESIHDCSCTTSKSSLHEANEDCKCRKDQWSSGKKTISRVYKPDSATSSCTSSIQNVDLNNFSGVVDIAAQTCARCASSKDNTNNEKSQLKEKCKCQVKSNKSSDPKQTGCDCKSKKEKSAKCPCSVASKTCSKCGSKISRTEKEQSFSCRMYKCSCKSLTSNKESNQECKCKSKSNKEVESKQSVCNCSGKKDTLSKCSWKSVKQSSDANCSQNREHLATGHTCSRCGSKLTKIEKQSSCSCRKPKCKCKSKAHVSKCPCNDKTQEPLKCSCKASKNSLNKTSQDMQRSASQTCSRCGRQQSQSSCSKIVDLSKSKSNSSIQDKSRCSCTSSKTATEFETCSRGIETKSVGSQTSAECCPQKDSKDLNLKSCNCRKSKCKCKSKKNELKDKCSCQTSKQKMTDADTNVCKSEKNKHSAQSGCTCNELKQSSLNTESNCKCNKQKTKPTTKPESSKCPCKSSSKQSLISNTCSQSSGTTSVASQTGSKRSSDQSRKSLRFSSDISPTRTIKSYSPISPKGSTCSIISQESCCSIYSTASGLSKSQSRTSVASQCSCGKKDASTVTRRSDRYDVRTLRLLTETSKVKCPCHSDSSVVRVRRQNNANNIPRCRSHGDQNYYFKHC